MRTQSVKTSIEAEWLGPFGWPTFEGSLRQIPNVPGVYLQTFEYQNGYLIYGAGITKRPVPTRLREHTLKYMSGDYTVLDLAAIKQGERQEIWHGWGWTPEKRLEFESRRKTILDAVRRQLEGYRIFVADIGNQPRIRARIEAAIMHSLYKQPSPLCDIPDRGMFLAPRKKLEKPIVVHNKCLAILHGLVTYLEI